MKMFTLHSLRMWKADVAVGVGLSQQYTVYHDRTIIVSKEPVLSAATSCPSDVFSGETGFNWNFITSTRVFPLFSHHRLCLCLFVRICSMILRLTASKRSMEKQESQFIDGTKFSKKDAFRES